MDYDANLRARIEECLENEPGVTVQRMFGGVCFMLNGHMLCGIARDQLVCRVGPGAYEKSLRLQHAKPMDFTGKPLAGMVYVDAAGVTNLSDLQKWLDRCIDFVKSLPSKDQKPGSRSKGKKAKAQKTSSAAKKATKKVATKKTATKTVAKKATKKEPTATKKVATKKTATKTVAKKATKKKPTATKKVATKKTATKTVAKKKTTTAKKKTATKKATPKVAAKKKSAAKKKKR